MIGDKESSSAALNALLSECTLNWRLIELLQKKSLHGWVGDLPPTIGLTEAAEAKTETKKGAAT